MSEQESKYQMSELQNLRLQIKQRDLQLAQKDALIAQRQYSLALNALGHEANRIRVENSWPDGLSFDVEKLAFIKPPKVNIPDSKQGETT